MNYSVRFSENEQELIEQYASLHSMKISEVIRKAALEMIEDDTDARAFSEAKKKRFDENPVTYSHEDICRELGFH